MGISRRDILKFSAKGFGIGVLLLPVLSLSNSKEITVTTKFFSFKNPHKNYESPEDFWNEHEVPQVNIHDNLKLILKRKELYKNSFSFIKTNNQGKTQLIYQVNYKNRQCYEAHATNLTRRTQIRGKKINSNSYMYYTKDFMCIDTLS